MKRIIAILMLVLVIAGAISGCVKDFDISLVSSVDEAETVTASTYDEAVTSTDDECTQFTTTQTATTEQPATKGDVVATLAPGKISQDKSETKVAEPSESKKPAKPVVSTGVSSEDEAGTKPQTATKPAVKPSTKPDKKYKYIAFTFDDGPHWQLTYKFVDKLLEYGGKGTFFVVGNRMGEYGSAAIKYAYDNGMEIGVHGYTHEYYYDTCSDSRFKSELSKTAKAIEKATGAKPTIMRPIGGGITKQRIKSCGYDVILWNVDTLDWKYSYRGTNYDKKENVNIIYNNIIKSTDENDIILLHEIYENSYDAFAKAVDTLYKKGYRFVTVSELLGRSQNSKGNLYYSAD